MNSSSFEDILETYCFHPSPEVNPEKKTSSWTWPLKSYPSLQPLYIHLSNLPEPASSPASCFLSNPSITARPVTLWGEKPASVFSDTYHFGHGKPWCCQVSQRSEGQQKGRPVHWNCLTYNQPYSFLLLCCHLALRFLGWEIWCQKFGNYLHN